MSKVSNPDDAQDILQDSLAKAVARIDTLKDSSKVTAWLYAIVRSSIIDFYRKKKPLTEPAELLATEEEEDKNNLNDNKGMARCLKGMMATLPKTDREILEAVEFNNESQAALSKHLGLSISGAKSKVQRAREKLKQTLLTCCRVETDSRGNIIRYKQKSQKNNCGTNACEGTRTAS